MREFLRLVLREFQWFEPRRYGHASLSEPIDPSGQRLDTLPPKCRESLGEELVLVQPYELPTEAGTEAGIARERELISLLGSG